MTRDDAVWLVGFLGRHVSRSVRGPDRVRDFASNYRLVVTPTVGHTIELHDYAGPLFRLLHNANRGAWVAWAVPNYSGLRTANENTLTFDVRRLLRRHGLLTRASQRRTA